MLALGFLPLVFAASLSAMGALMLLASLAIAPATAVEYVLIDRLAPPGTSTEAFGWVITATVLGPGIGSAVGGAVVNGGHVRLGFVLALAGALLAWVASAVGRPALRANPGAVSGLIRSRTGTPVRPPKMELCASRSV